MSNTSKKNASITGTEQIMVGEGRDFERIRRITGYLVGTIDRWNNAKRAEEKDRVKHTMSDGGSQEARP